MILIVRSIIDAALKYMHGRIMYYQLHTIPSVYECIQLTLYVVAVNPCDPSSMILLIGSSSGAIGRSAPVLAVSPFCCP